MFPFVTTWLIINTFAFQIGFLATGTYVVSYGAVSVQAQDCGGELPADPSGEIHNPDEDGDWKYDDNSECIWTITAEFSKVIEIQFYYIELEYDPSCLYDYVQVFDGEIRDYLMGQFCGDETPEPLKSSGNVVTIRFKSDASESFYGFGIVYFERNGTSGLRLCGSIQNSLAGTVASIDDDSNGYYDDGVTCTWKIKFPSYDKKIQLYFLKMALQASENCQQDYVKVSDAKTVFGVFCGTEMSPVITSSANDLYVDFISDDNTHDEGFLAVYTAIDGDLQCGAILTEPSGNIVSTDRDENGEYDADLQCVWVIAAPAGAGVALNFHDLDIESDDECLFDYLESCRDGATASWVINQYFRGVKCLAQGHNTAAVVVQLFDGSFTAESSLGRICGDAIPTTIMTVTNVLFVEFYSDDSVTFGGFHASYQQRQGQKLCGPIQTDLAGRLASLDASSGRGINCTWRIMVSETNKLIELYLVILDIPSADSCTSDYIKVYDENTTYGIFCGTNETHNMISTSGVLNVDVFSDASVSGHAFTAYFSTIDPDHQCGGILSSPAGTLRSVDRDQNSEYDPDLHCVWVIVAPAGKRIKVEIMEFGLEQTFGCYYDYLKLVDGVFKSGTSTEDLFCGKNSPAPMITKSNTLYMEFQSDGSTQDTGFLANYIFIDASDIQTTKDTSTTDITTTYSSGASSASITDTNITTVAGTPQVTFIDTATVKYKWIRPTETEQNETTTQKVGTTKNIRHTTEDRDSAVTDAITTATKAITTVSDNVTTPSDDVTTLSDDVDDDTPPADVFAPSDDATTPLGDVTTPSDDATTHGDVTTPSDDATTPSDDFTTQSADSTTLSDNVTSLSSSDDETTERIQTSPSQSERREGGHTSGKTSPKTVKQSTDRTEQNATSKEMTTVKSDGANLTTVTVTSEDSAVTPELVSEAYITTVSAMSEMDKSDCLLHFCLLLYFAVSLVKD